MADGIKFNAYIDDLDAFTVRYQYALKKNKVLEIARPEDGHARYINPHQILYYELWFDEAEVKQLEND